MSQQNLDPEVIVGKMNYNFLGKSGIRVSNICLGTMTFGSASHEHMAVFYSNPKQADEPTAHKILDRYAELGGNFIDTANIYSCGNSERIVGAWLKKQNRDNFIVATKVRFAMDGNAPNSVGLSRRHIVKSCEDSLGRLQTDYIDLFQAHMWDNGTPIEDTLRTLDDLVRSGKVRYYGFSNVCGWQLQKIVEIAKYTGLNPCVSLQQQYSLLQRDSEFETFMVCENEGIALLPWSPLKGGMLTGKFKPNEVPNPSDSRAGYMHMMMERGEVATSIWDEYGNDERYWKLIVSLGNIAKVHTKTIPQVSLRWLIQKDVVSSVVVGATSVQQLEENVGASCGWELTSEQMQELNEISPRHVHYPYDVIWGVSNTTRFNRANHSIKM